MLRKLGLAAIAIGFMLVFIALILVTLAAVFETGEREKNSTRPEAGIAGCIILFFIPVCFATGSPNVVQVLLVIAMISVLVILLITLSIFFLLPLIRWIKLKNLGKAS